MLFKDECKYYAPCGLCTYYDKPCNEICKSLKHKTHPKNLGDSSYVTSKEIKEQRELSPPTYINKKE